MIVQKQNTELNNKNDSGLKIQTASQIHDIRKNNKKMVCFKSRHNQQGINSAKIDFDYNMQQDPTHTNRQGWHLFDLIKYKIQPNTNLNIVNLAKIIKNYDFGKIAKNTWTTVPAVRQVGNGQGISHKTTDSITKWQGHNLRLHQAMIVNPSMCNPIWITNMMQLFKIKGLKAEFKPQQMTEPKLWRHCFDQIVTNDNDFAMYRVANYCQITKTQGAGAKVIIGAMLNELAKQGGMLKYIKNTAIKRPDAMGLIKYNILSEEYETWPRPNMPVKECKCCGILNVMNELHNDINKKKLKYDIESFTDDGSILYRCGACGMDLSSTIQNYQTLYHQPELSEDFPIWFIGMEAQKLITLGLGDGYDRLKPEAKSRLDKHDLKIMQRYFAVYNMQPCYIGIDVPDTQMNHLRKSYPTLTYKHSLTRSSNMPYLLAEMASAQQWIVQMIDKNIDTGIDIDNINQSRSQLISLGDILPPAHKSIKHDWYYNNCTNQQGYYQYCTHQQQCECNIEISTFYGGPAISNIPIKDTLKMVRQNQGMFYYILKMVPLNNNIKILLNGNQGECFNTIDNTLVFFNGTTEPLILHKYNHKILVESNILIDQNDTYIITTIKETDNFLIRFITYSTQDELIQNITSTSSTDNVLKITLPLPNIKNMFSILPIVNVEMQEFELYIDLLDALIQRNLTQKVSWAQLRQYAIAFCLQRYVTHTKTIRNPNIMYQHIDIAILVCKLATAKQNAQSDVSFDILKILDKIPLLKGLIANKLNEHLVHAIKYIFEMLQESTNIDFQQLLSIITNGYGQYMISGMVTDPIWNNLGDLVMRKTQIAVTTNHVIHDGQSEISANNNIICSHHTTYCDHMLVEGNQCQCCNMPYVLVNQLCHCCDAVKTLPMSYEDISDFSDDVDSYEYYVDFNEFKNDNKVKDKQINHVHEHTHTHIHQHQDNDNYKKKQIKEPVIQQITISPDIVDDQQQNIQPQSIDVKKQRVRHQKAKRLINIIDDEDDSKWLNEKNIIQNTVNNRIQEQTVVFKKKDKQEQQIGNSIQQKLLNLAVQMINPNESTVNSIIKTVGLPFYQYVMETTKFLQLQPTINSQTYSNFYYVPVGVTRIMDKTWIQRLTLVNYPNDAVNSCGYNALVGSLGNSTLKLDEFREIAQTDQNFDVDSIIKVCQIMMYNVIIVTPYDVILINNDEKNTVFAGIIHSAAVNDQELDNAYVQEGHYFGAAFRQINKLPQYTKHPQCVNEKLRTIAVSDFGYDINTYYTAVNNSDNLLIETTILQIVNNLGNLALNAQLPSLLKQGNDFYFTNNVQEVNNISNGQVHCQVRNDSIHILQQLYEDPKYAIQSKIFTEDYNRPLMIPDNLVVECNSKLIEQVRYILQLKNAVNNKILDKFVKTKFKATIHIQGKSGSFAINNEYIKTLDWVIIKNKEKNLFMVSILKVGDIAYFNNKDLLENGKYTILLLTRSVGSAIRAMYSLIQPVVLSGIIARTYLLNCQAIDGLPGSGKSTQLIQDIKGTTVILSKTSANVDNLRTKYQNSIGYRRLQTDNVYIMSLERASNWHALKQIDTLLIDEASMVDFLDIINILKLKPSVLKIYGDTTQIGNKDMIETKGRRHQLSLFDYVTTKNIIEFNTIRRFSQSVIDQLQLLLPSRKIINSCEHQTIFKIHNIPSLLHKNFKQIIQDVQPHTIVTPYQNNRKLILDLIANTTVKVTTTHSYQGLEAERVILVLACDDTGSWDLCTNDKYLVSGITRATHRLEIIVVGYNTNIEKITDLKITGGAVGNQITINEQYLNLYGDLTLTTLHKAPQPIIDHLCQTVMVQNNIQCKSTMDNNILTLIYSKFGLKVVKIIIGDNLFQVDSTLNSVYQKIMEQKDQPILSQLLSVRMDNVTTQQQGKNYLMSYNQVNRLATLAYIVDASQNNLTRGLILVHKKTVVRLYCGTGCPLMAGITMYNNDTEEIMFQISSGYYTLFNRTMYINPSYYRNKQLKELLDWLKITDDNIIKTPFVEESVYSNIIVNASNLIIMTLERIISYPYILMHYISDVEGGHCGKFKQSNAIRSQAATLSFKALPNHSLLNRNLWINQRQSKLLFYFKYYESYVVDTTYSLHYSKCSDQLNMAIQFNAILKHLTFNKLITRDMLGIGAQIEGLRMDLDTHIKKNTETGYYAARKMLEQELHMKDATQNNIWLSPLTFDNLRQDIRQTYPNLHVNRDNEDYQQDPAHEVLNVLMMQQMGRVAKNKIIGYHAYDCQLPYKNSKHYFISFKPFYSQFKANQWQRYQVTARQHIQNYIRQYDTIDQNKFLDEHLQCNQQMIQVDRQIAGIDLQYMPVEHVAKLIEFSREKCIYGYMANAQHKHTKYYKIDPNQELLIMYYGESIHHKQNYILKSALNTGRQFTVDGKYYNMSVIKNLFDHAMVIIKQTTQEFKYYRQIDCVEMFGDIHIIEMPYFNTQIFSLLQGNNLFNVKKIKVMIRIYRLLMHRLTVGKCTRDDLLAYVRTLLQTHQMNSNGIYVQYNVNFMDIIDTVNLCVYMYENQLSKFDQIIQLFNQFEHNQIAAQMITELIMIVTNVENIVAQTISKYINPESITKILSQCKIGFSIQQYKQMQEKMTIIFDRQISTIVQYNDDVVTFKNVQEIYMKLDIHNDQVYDNQAITDDFEHKMQEVQNKWYQHVINQTTIQHQQFQQSMLSHEENILQHKTQLTYTIPDMQTQESDGEGEEIFYSLGDRLDYQPKAVPEPDWTFETIYQAYLAYCGQNIDYITVIVEGIKINIISPILYIQKINIFKKINRELEHFNSPNGTITYTVTGNDVATLFYYGIFDLNSTSITMNVLVSDENMRNNLLNALVMARIDAKFNRIFQDQIVILSYRVTMCLNIYYQHALKIENVSTPATINTIFTPIEDGQTAETDYYSFASTELIELNKTYVEAYDKFYLSQQGSVKLVYNSHRSMQNNDIIFAIDFFELTGKIEYEVKNYMKFGQQLQEKLKIEQQIQQNIESLQWNDAQLKIKLFSDKPKALIFTSGAIGDYIPLLQVVPQLLKRGIEVYCYTHSSLAQNAINAGCFIILNPQDYRQIQAMITSWGIDGKHEGDVDESNSVHYLQMMQLQTLLQLKINNCLYLFTTPWTMGTQYICKIFNCSLAYVVAVPLVELEQGQITQEIVTVTKFPNKNDHQAVTNSEIKYISLMGYSNIAKTHVPTIDQVKTLIGYPTVLLVNEFQLNQSNITYTGFLTINDNFTIDVETMVQYVKKQHDMGKQVAIVTFGSVSTTKITVIADKCITAALENNLSVVYVTASSQAFGSSCQHTIQNVNMTLTLGSQLDDKLYLVEAFSYKEHMHIFDYGFSHQGPGVLSQFIRGNVIPICIPLYTDQSLQTRAVLKLELGLYVNKDEQQAAYNQITWMAIKQSTKFRQNLTDVTNEINTYDVQNDIDIWLSDSLNLLHLGESITIDLQQQQLLKYKPKNNIEIINVEKTIQEVIDEILLLQKQYYEASCQIIEQLSMPLQQKLKQIRECVNNKVELLPQIQMSYGNQNFYVMNPVVTYNLITNLMKTITIFQQNGIDYVTDDQLSISLIKTGGFSNSIFNVNLLVVENMELQLEQRVQPDLLAIGLLLIKVQKSLYVIQQKQMATNTIGNIYIYLMYYTNDDNLQLVDKNDKILKVVCTMKQYQSRISLKCYDFQLYVAAKMPSFVTNDNIELNWKINSINYTRQYSNKQRYIVVSDQVNLYNQVHLLYLAPIITNENYKFGYLSKATQALLSNNKPKVILTSIGSLGDLIPFNNIIPALHQMGYQVITYFDECYNQHINLKAIKLNFGVSDPKQLFSVIEAIGFGIFNIPKCQQLLKTQCHQMVDLLSFDIKNVQLIITTPWTALSGAIAMKYQCKTALLIPNPWVTHLPNAVQNWIAEQLSDVLPHTRILTSQMIENKFLQSLGMQKYMNQRNPIEGAVPTAIAVNESIVLKEHKIQNTTFIGFLSIYDGMYSDTTEMQQFLIKQHKQIKILVSFGSLIFKELPAIIDKITQLTQLLNFTLVICVGVSGINDLYTTCGTIQKPLKYGTNEHNDQIFVSHPFSYSQYISKFDMCISQHGAGILAQCLVNCVIPISIPIFGDQFYLAKRIKDEQWGIVINHNANLDQISIGINTAILQHEHLITNLKVIQNQILSDNVTLNTFNWLTNEVFLPNLTVTSKAYFNKVASLNISSTQINAALQQTMTKMNFPIHTFGIFKTKLLKDTELYNPHVTENCFWLCVQKFVDMTDIDTCNNYQNAFETVNKLNVSDQDIVQVCFLLNINVGFYDEFTQMITLINLHPGNAIIVLKITSDMPRHAILMNSQYIDIMNIKPILHNSVSTSINNNMVIADIALNNDMTIKDLQTCHQSLINFKNNINMNSIDNIKARLSLTQLQYILQSRKKMPVHYTQMQFDQKIIMLEVNMASNNRLVLIAANDQWLLGYTMLLNGKSFIYSFINVYNVQNFVIDLGTDFIKKGSVAQKQIYSSTHNIYALNINTLKFITSSNTQYKTNKIISGGVASYCLVIHQYDNRTHHQGLDEYECIINAEKTIWTGDIVTKTNIAEFVATRNKPYDRRAYARGKLCYAAELSSQVLTSVWKAMTQAFTMYVEQISTTVYYNAEVNDSFLDILVDRCTEQVTKLQWKLTCPLESGVISKAELQIQLFSPSSTADDIDEITFTQCMVHLYGRDYNKESYCIKIFDDYFSISNIDYINIEKICVPVTVNNQPAILNTRYMILFKVLVIGGNLSDRALWNIENVQQGTKTDNWFITEKQNVRFTQQQTNGLKNITALQMNQVDQFVKIKPIQINNLFRVTDDFLPYYCPFFNNAILNRDLLVWDEPYKASMDMWDQLDHMDWLDQFAPLEKDCIIKSRERPDHMMHTTITTLSEYPAHARNVITQVSFEESRAIVGRLYSKVHLRKEKNDIDESVLELANAYFRKDWKEIVGGFQQNLVTYDAQATQEWIEQSKMPDEKLKATLNFINNEIRTCNMNDVKVHVKHEVLMKSEPITNLRAQEGRIIVAHKAFMAAIFSPIFLQLKDRLKQLLRQEVIYTDGLRPDELSSFLQNQNDVTSFYENDLTKQDRQSDEHIFDVEHAIYQLLGVHPEVLNSYRSIHRTHRISGQFIKSLLEAQRSSGEPTTALGNVITNMQVHAKLVLQNYNRIKFILFLGDDSIIGCKSLLDTDKYRQYIEDYYNMQSKAQNNNNFGTFCQFIIHKNSIGTCNLGPDYVRMRFKYEVSNGDLGRHPENIELRAMSFLMNLGDTAEVKQAIQKLNLPIQPIHYYEQSSLVNALSQKYDINDFEVMGHFNQLINMIEQPTVFSRDFQHFTSKYKKY